MVANGVLAIIQLITASKGNLMKKFTLLASLLTLGISTAQAIVIPDLFGSYEKGAEAARQANRQSGYYGYYPSSPSISYDFLNSDGSSKWSKRISIKDKDIFCWSVRNLDPYRAYNATEVFSGLNGARLQAKSIKPFEIFGNSNDAVVLGTSVNQNGEGIYNCWTFHSEMPTGKYIHQVYIDGIRFPTAEINIIK